MITSIASTKVHWTQPKTMALSETDGHGDTCGEITILDDLAVRFPGKYQLTIAELDKVRADCVTWGLHSGGMTLYSIGEAFRQHYGVTPVKVVSWAPNLDFQVFRHDLINAMLNHQPVVMQTSKGYALRDNQTGVLQHFIYIAGIDTGLGYWVCNGDTYWALQNGPVTSPAWETVSYLQASAPDAYLILPAIDPVTPPIPPVTPPAINWQAKYTTLKTKLSADLEAN